MLHRLTSVFEDRAVGFVAGLSPAEVRARFLFNPCDTRGGQSGTGAACSSSTLVSSSLIPPVQVPARCLCLRVRVDYRCAGK